MTSSNGFTLADAQNVYDISDPRMLLDTKLSSGTLCGIVTGVDHHRGFDGKPAEEHDMQPTTNTDRGTASNRPPARLLHRPCAACKKVKVRCDYKQPCGRCVRLGTGDQCAPPPDVKRGRPPKHASEAATSSSAEIPAPHTGSHRHMANAHPPPASAPTATPPPLFLVDDSEWPALPTRTSSLMSVPHDEQPRSDSRRGSARRSWHLGKSEEQLLRMSLDDS